MKPVINRIEARAAGSMGVRGGAATEFLYFSGGIDGMVLPVPVAVEEERVMLRVLSHPFANLDPFLCKGIVGVIVMLVAAIGSNNRRGRDDDLPMGFA